VTRSLQEVTTPIDHAITVDDTWLQGRGAYGGLTVAALVRAIEARVADPRRRVRSVTAELPAPTPVGANRIDAEILRSGNQVTTARATIRNGDVVSGHAVAVLAASRETGGDVAWRHLEPPVLPAWTELAPAPMSGPGVASFAQHFELRVVTGIPFTSGEPVTTGWVRAREPGELRDAAYVAAMIDVWYPGFMVSLRAPRPLATIAYTLELFDSLDGLDPVVPLAYRGTVPVCGDGYFVETRELGGSDGRPGPRNHQPFAIIRCRRPSPALCDGHVGTRRPDRATRHQAAF